MTIPSPIESPCDKVCTLEPTSGLCFGCGRTLAEIERWATYSDGERTRIMTELPDRLTTLQARRMSIVRA
jgi:predicted Fe-S protein YdhL (DUF1289 family)